VLWKDKVTHCVPKMLLTCRDCVVL